MQVDDIHHLGAQLDCKTDHFCLLFFVKTRACHYRPRQALAGLHAALLAMDIA